MNSLVVFALLLAVVSAQYHGHVNSESSHHADHYAPPSYNYEYQVHDAHTGDIKSAHESRHGDVVKGFYTLKESDGTTREVHYTADDHHGFNAEVKTIGHAVHHQPIHHQQPSHYH